MGCTSCPLVYSGNNHAKVIAQADRHELRHQGHHMVLVTDQELGK
jgi:hypothetical protein